MNLFPTNKYVGYRLVSMGERTLLDSIGIIELIWSYVSEILSELLT